MISRESIIIVSILLIAGYFLSLNQPPTARILENNLEITESTPVTTTVPQNTQITTVVENQEEVQPENNIIVTSTTTRKGTSTTQESSIVTTTTEETSTTLDTTSTTLVSKSNLFFVEIYYDTAGDDNNEEYIVIHNPNSEAVNLDGFSISDNSGSWSFPNTVINAQDYLVIARDAAGFSVLFNCQPDIDGFTRGLNNDGDQLSLSKDGQEKDFVAWEKGVADAYPDWGIKTGNGKVLKKTGSGNSASDWSEADPDPCGY